MVCFLSKDGSVAVAFTGCQLASCMLVRYLRTSLDPLLRRAIVLATPQDEESKRNTAGYQSPFRSSKTIGERLHAGPQSHVVHRNIAMCEQTAKSGHRCTCRFSSSGIVLSVLWKTRQYCHSKSGGCPFRAVVFQSIAPAVSRHNV